MNVFILGTGRSGTTTFIRASEHITNFTAGHETLWGKIGPQRFAYPNSHIEADNRLSWLLGRLDQYYKNRNVIYVHLRRDPERTARSFSSRVAPGGILHEYKNGVLSHIPGDIDPFSLALDYVETVNCNIEIFLRGIPNSMSFQLENYKEDWPRFWQLIGAEGDYESSIKEFSVAHNASGAPCEPPSMLQRLPKKLKRVALGLPQYLKYV